MKEQNYIIATASTSDLTREYLEAHHIPYIPYTYEIDGVVYEEDCREETRQEVFRKMREGAMLTTAAINPITYFEFFEKLVQTGKDVLFLDMAEPISSSFWHASQAAEEIMEKYPDRQVINVDTRCISGGLGLLVEGVMKLYEAGESKEDVLQWIENNKLRIAHRFTIDSLEWLRRSGRLSNVSAFLGSALSIKPVLYVTDEGVLVATQKVIGRRKALNKIVEQIRAEVKSTEGLVFRIYHADCREDAEYVRDQLREAYPELPDEDITISVLGATIGSHVGPGLFTTFYMTDARRP